MVAKKNIQTTIYVSTKYTASQLETIGKGIVEKIVKRTQSGINKNGSSFPGYSKQYIKEKGSSHVDLTLTEDMLTELDVLSVSPGKIVIGYPEGHPDAGKVEGNQLGTYGNQTPIPGKARPFIGITEDEKELIIAKAEQSFGGIDEEKSKFLESFISNLIGGQGE